MIRVIVAGATGRTGAAVFDLADSAERFELVGGIADKAREGTPPVFPSLEGAPDADVLVDFTTADIAPSLVAKAAELGMAIVSGTTGLDDDGEALIKEAAKSAPIVRSGNFSLGVNILETLVEQAAKKLEGFDIEVTEAHHRRKVDAPSGTALMLGEAAAKGLGASLSERSRFDRHGQTGPRKDGEIGFSVIRGGGVPGDHTVSFLSDHEVVSITHRAMDRRLFAEGALAAARWVYGRSPGLYSMRDVLALD